jgi:hypothetical protein
MKKKYMILTSSIFLLAAATVSSALAEPITKSFNEKGYGTIFGRIQSVSMARDYDGKGNGSNSTIGGFLGYTTPEFKGFDASLAFNYAEEIYDNNNTDLLANDSIHVLNEAWVRYNFNSTGLSDTTVTLGRKINNAEIFRADDIRQKSRAIEAIQFAYNGQENLKVAGGHALKASGVFQIRDVGEFNDFGDIFGADDDTDGITWVEATYKNADKFELVLFDALAWDVTNMIGTRVKYNLTQNTSILGYGRVEFDTGSAPTHDGSTFGVSLAQKVGQVNLEGGYLGVYDDGLKFQQATTGFNHALGSSLMIYAKNWDAGADTYYIKATTKIEKTGTFLYTLCNYITNAKASITGVPNSDYKFDGYEIDIIISQPIVDNFKATFKGAYGEKETADGGHDQGTDVRLFLTYTL